MSKGAFMAQSTVSITQQQPAQESTRPQSAWYLIWREFKKHKLSMAGLVVLTLFLLFALIAPYVTQDPNLIDLAAETRLTSPSPAHWFGTDHLGRDVLARSMNGARISLSVGFIATVIAIVIGTLVGGIAGFFGGAVDNLLMRIIDLFMSLPIIFVLIILQGILEKPSIYNVMVVIGATSWMGTARIVRGQILKERETDYVMAAYAIGGAPGWIIFRHLLPNVIGPVIVVATLRVGSAIILEASLSFIGFGVQAPHASWGSMLSEAKGYLNTGPWMAIFPGILLSMTVLAFNFVGDGLASALNPYERR